MLQLSGGWCGGGCWVAGYPRVLSRRPLQACPMDSLALLSVSHRGPHLQPSAAGVTACLNITSLRFERGQTRLYSLWCDGPWTGASPENCTCTRASGQSDISAGGRQETAWRRPPPTARCASGRWEVEARTRARRCSIRSPTAHSCSQDHVLLARANTDSTHRAGLCESLSCTCL